MLGVCNLQTCSIQHQVSSDEYCLSYGACIAPGSFGSERVRQHWGSIEVTLDAMRREEACTRVAQLSRDELVSGPGPEHKKTGRYLPVFRSVSYVLTNLLVGCIH
jgi:hypothetical protein